MRTRDPDAEELVTLSYYLADYLADLERQGRLRALPTQDIDGLHPAAGSAPERC